MNQWTDPFSGVIYRWEDSWLKVVIYHPRESAFPLKVIDLTQP